MENQKERSKQSIEQPLIGEKFAPVIVPVVKPKVKYIALPNTVIVKRKLLPMSDILFKNSPKLAMHRQQQDALDPTNNFIVHDVDEETGKQSNLKKGDLIRLVVQFGYDNSGKEPELSISPLGMIRDKEEEDEYLYLIIYPNGGVLCKVEEIKVKVKPDNKK